MSACAPGYSNPIGENRLCHKCAPGFVHTGYLGKCVACPKGVWSLVTPMLWTLAAVVFLVVLVGLKIRSSGSAKAAHSVILRQVMIHHLQTLIIVLSMNVSWPRFVWVVSEVVGSVVNTEDHVAAIACVFKSHDSSEASNRGAYFFFFFTFSFPRLPCFLFPWRDRFHLLAANCPEVPLLALWSERNPRIQVRGLLSSVGEEKRS